MRFRKSLSLVMIASQAGLGTAAWAGQPAGSGASANPEFALVESVLALQGQQISAADRQNILNSNLTAYLDRAPSDRSQARFENALIQLGVYSAQQAHSFVEDAQAAAQNVVGAKAISPQQAEAAVSSEIAQLAAMHPAGAEFSSQISYDACVASGLVAGAGAVAALVGFLVRFNNPTCNTPTENVQTCGPQGCYSTTITGETTCAVADYYPDAQQGNEILIGSGIALGVAALLFAISGFGQNCN